MEERTTTAVVRITPNIKNPRGKLGLKIWAGADEILTNYTFDVYEMLPYLMEMNAWLNELDSKKSDWVVILMKLQSSTIQMNSNCSLIKI